MPDVVVPNLVQGVTQQAPQQARYSQCAKQFDCLNSASEGAGARPASELVKVWASRNLTGAFFAETSNDDESYLLGVTSAGDPFAIDLADGTDCTMTVTAPNLNYLTTGALIMRSRLRSQVAEDFTFIANREVTAAMAGTTSSAKVEEALIFVRATQLNTTYRVTVSGTGVATVAAYFTTNDATVVPTSSIAEDIRTTIAASADWAVIRSGSVLRIRRTDGGVFDVDTADGSGDESLLAFYGEASSLDRLPKRGFPGMVIKVGGEDRSQEDDYFLKFTGQSTTGRWVETVGPGVQTTINSATMPHAIVNTGYRTFEFRRPSWSTRIAGDGVKTAKDPSFIGKKVRDVFYHQKRLGLLTASAASFSKADAAFTHFPDTVQTQLDTAPVDIKPSSPSGKGSASLDFGVHVNEKLYLWAQRQQHAISHGQESGFSQKTVSTNEASSYEYSAIVDPMPMGPFLYFPTDIGLWSAVRALQFGGNGKVAGEVDLTAHAPGYVPAAIHTITGAETLRTIFMLSSLAPDKVTVFNFLWDGEKFAQQAFNTWRIPGGQILWMSVRGNFLRFLQQRPEGLVYGRINLTPRVKDAITGAKYQTRLDHRVTEAQVTGLAYNSTTKTSSFTLPYQPTGPDFIVAVAEAVPDGHARGRSFEVVSVVGAVVTVRGDLTPYKFYAGQRITAERTELEFFIRTDDGSAPTDRLTVNKVFFSMSDSGYTRVEASTPNGWFRKYVYEGRRLGDTTAVIGEPPIANGDVGGEIGQASKDVTIRLVNDSFLPSYWQNGAYEFTAVGWKGVK